MDPSVQRKVASMSDEMSKIRQKHKENVSAQADQVKNQLDMLKRKKEQILDAQAKRNKATNANKANTNNSTAGSTHHDPGLSTGAPVQRHEHADVTIAIDAMLNEKLATGGFNYEKEINDKLKKAGKAHADSTTAGSSADAPDAKFNHNGKEHNLEVKQNQKAMFGQIELKHDGKKWDISERSKKKYPHTTDSILATGFLDKVNKQWDKPTGDYDTDLQKGNVYHTHHDAEPIKAHYGKDRKTDYIQIGGGHGFYHTGNDAAKLGSPELEGKATLRARMKYRGTDRKTGKKKYGALIVMGLKDAEKSHHNLDETIQRKWIEAALNETVLNPKDPHKDYAQKSKTLQDLSRNKDVDQAHVQQRRLDLDKEYAKYKKESLDEAHKIGDKVQIVKGSSAGIVGHIGEIRHGAFKGAPKTYTVYHGEKDATQVKKEHIKAVKENATDWGSILNEDAKCFVDAFWSGQQEEPKKNPYAEGTTEYYQYENGYMQGVMKRRVMQTESRGHKVLATFFQKRNSWAPVAPVPDKKYIKGTPEYQAHKATKKPINGHPTNVKEEIQQVDELSNELLQKYKDKAKKSADDLADKGQYGKSNDRLLNHMKATGKQIEKTTANISKALRKEEVAANNVGGGAIAGTQGDAGKKVVMTKEPLKRKPLPKFKTYVSQEHDGY